MTVSDYSRKRLDQLGIAPAEEIDVVPNGVDHLPDPDERVLPRWRRMSYVIGSASTLPHKNLGLLLDAFAQRELKDLQLVLTGGGSVDDLRELRDVVPDNVHLAGYLQEQELAGLYANALAVCIPSRVEGFGMPALEAMHHGTPAIISGGGALEEVCGSAAMIARPDVVEDWVAAVLSLHREPALRSELVEKGLAQSANYTWAASARRLANILLRWTDQQVQIPS